MKKERKKIYYNAILKENHNTNVYGAPYRFEKGRAIIRHAAFKDLLRLRDEVGYVEYHHGVGITTKFAFPDDFDIVKIEEITITEEEVIPFISKKREN